MTQKIFRFGIFIIIIAVIDQLSGFGVKKLYEHTNSGIITKLRYTIDSTKQNILFFGSSRAENHYIPTIITNNTSLSSYNCGFGGQGLVFSFIQISETLKRYKPKIIVLDIAPDIVIDNACDDRMKVLLPYAQRDTLILNSLINKSELEKFKFISSVYPYNGLIGPLIFGFFSQYKDTTMGYVQLNGELKTEKLKVKTIESPKYSPQKRQVDYMHRIINICKSNNIKLLMVISPIYEKNIMDEQINKKIISIAEGEAIPIVNFADSVSKFSNEKLFRDKYHLNINGASIFSKAISNYILSRHFNFN